MAKGGKKTRSTVAEKASVGPLSLEPSIVDRPYTVPQIIHAPDEAPLDALPGQIALLGLHDHQVLPGGQTAGWGGSQVAATATHEYSGWGAGADAADDQWGTPTDGSPAFASGADAAADTGRDWGMPAGDASMGGWGNPTSPAHDAMNVKKMGKKSKKTVTPSAPPIPAPLATPSLNADRTAGGWAASPGAGRRPTADTWGVPPNNVGLTWGEPPAQAQPPPPPQASAVAEHAPSMWKTWGREGKVLPKSQPPPPMDAAQRQQYAAAHQEAAAAIQHELMQQQLRTQLEQARMQQVQQFKQQQQLYGGGNGSGGMAKSRQQHSTYSAPSVQQSDSWGSAGWGNNNDNAWGAETIYEEDEEDEDYEDDEDDYYGEEKEEDYDEGYHEQNGYDGWDSQNDGNHVHFSPTVSRHTGTPRNHGQPPPVRTPQSAMQKVTPTSPWGNTSPSRTMAMASGRSTTIFELAPPRNGFGENQFVSSHGESLRYAQRALFGREHLAKRRIRWALDPDKDERVSSLLRWIHAMSNGLAIVGLNTFLQTGERGALITNADYHANADVGAPTQPAFDWISLARLQETSDRVLQESVAVYDPAARVIVFVFLLSPSGNSMAVWRRKLAIPEALRQAYEKRIAQAKERLPQDVPVYVDELPPKEEPPAPPVPPKKKYNLLSKLKWQKKPKT